MVDPAAHDPETRPRGEAADRAGSFGCAGHRQAAPGRGGGAGRGMAGRRACSGGTLRPVGERRHRRPRPIRADAPPSLAGRSDWRLPPMRSPRPRALTGLRRCWRCSATGRCSCIPGRPPARRRFGRRGGPRPSSTPLSSTPPGGPGPTAVARRFPRAAGVLRRPRRPRAAACRAPARPRRHRRAGRPARLRGDLVLRHPRGRRRAASARRGRHLPRLRPSLRPARRPRPGSGCASRDHRHQPRAPAGGRRAQEVPRRDPTARFSRAHHRPSDFRN